MFVMCACKRDNSWYVKEACTYIHKFYLCPLKLIRLPSEYYGMVTCTCLLSLHVLYPFVASLSTMEFWLKTWTIPFSNITILVKYIFFDIFNDGLKISICVPFVFTILSHIFKRMVTNTHFGITKYLWQNNLPGPSQSHTQFSYR